MDCIAIKDIRNGMKNINVIFIVLDVTASTKTKENREVFSFKVADPTASINCSIWDAPGKLLIPGDIVKLTKAYASHWRGCLTLYSGKNGEIMKMGDFCMVFNEQVNMSETVPQNAAPIQGNHISANNGNGGGGGGGAGGNNGNNGKALGTAPAQVAIPPPSNQQTTAAPNVSSSGKPAPKAAAPPSKYMRKPINKK